MREQLLELVDALERGEERLICQVVESRGSTPQKAGALMVVAPDARQWGTLGGGCVENEIKLKALRQVGREGAATHSVILDHDYAWADGLICGGKMVFVTASARGPTPLAYFRTQLDLLESGLGFSEAVVVAPESTEAAVGARYLFDAAQTPVAAWLGPLPPDRAIIDLVTPLDGRPRSRTQGGVAWMPHLPRVRLIVVGAGHVGQAVADLAADCDFDPWIVDDRAQYASPDRFPKARRLLVGPIEQVLADLAPQIDASTYALIVTRGHGHDQEALFHLAPTSAGYVGLIGSKRKIRLIFEGLRAQGIPESALARVTAPVGLEIGSQSVPEIAVSIVAELVARRNLGASKA